MIRNTSCEQLIYKGSPFELQDISVGGVHYKVFPYGPQTLNDIFIKTAAFADHEFIISGNIRLTFGQAFQRGKNFARNLRQKYNIKKGNRIAVIMETGPEWAVAFMAFCFAGASPVVIPIDAEGRDMVNALELTNCALAVADLPSAGKIKASGMKRPVVIPIMQRSDAISYIGATSGFSVFNLAVASGCINDADINEARETTPDDEAMISFTPGTTGKPKGVIYSHRNITTGLMNMMLSGLLMSLRTVRDVPKQTDDALPCSLMASPFSHIGGYSQLMLTCCLGGKIVLMPEWNTARATALIESERVRSLCGLSPAMATDLLRSNQLTNSLRVLSRLNIHGFALHRSFIRELADEFPFINMGSGYGMAETFGAISMVSGMDMLNNPEFSGRTLPSVNVKIVDREGRETARGDHGEIWVRGAMVMRGYCSGKDDSRVVLEDGWLKTGDLGCIDQAGNLYVADETGLFNRKCTVQ